MARLQLSVSDDEARDWKREARSLGLTSGQLIRLRMAGKLVSEKAKAAEPVQAAVHGSSISKRIFAIVGNQPIKKAMVRPLAVKLDVPERSIYAALGSLVASKRMVRSGDEYRLVDPKEE